METEHLGLETLIGATIIFELQSEPLPLIFKYSGRRSDPQDDAVLYGNDSAQQMIVGLIQKKEHMLGAFGWTAPSRRPTDYTPSLSPLPRSC